MITIILITKGITRLTEKNRAKITISTPQINEVRFISENYQTRLLNLNTKTKLKNTFKLLIEKFCLYVFFILICNYYYFSKI